MLANNKPRPALASLFETTTLLPYTQAVETPLTPLIALGNDRSFRIRPYDTSVLRIGKVSGITVGVQVNLVKKTADNHTIVACDFNYGENRGYCLQINNNGSFVFFSGQAVVTSAQLLFPYGKRVWVVCRINGAVLSVFIDKQKVWTTQISRVENGGGVGNQEVTYFGEEGSRFRTSRGEWYSLFAIKASLADQQIVSGNYQYLDILYKEKQGNILIDSSGNQNHGVLT